MAWKREREPWYVLYKPWRWELIFSSHGLSYGRSWTKRGAGDAMLKEQGRMFAE